MELQLKIECPDLFSQFGVTEPVVVHIGSQIWNSEGDFKWLIIKPQICSSLGIADSLFARTITTDELEKAYHEGSLRVAQIGSTNPESETTSPPVHAEFRQLPEPAKERIEHKPGLAGELGMTERR